MVDFEETVIVAWIRKDQPLTAGGITTIVTGGLVCNYCRFPEFKSDIPVSNSEENWQTKTCIECDRTLEECQKGPWTFDFEVK